MKSFKILIILTLVSTLLGFAAVPTLRAAAARPEAGMNTLCPVMPGTRVNKKFWVDYEGRRILLCCRSCVKAFKKNPQKYLSRLS